MSHRTTALERVTLSSLVWGDLDADHIVWGDEEHIVWGDDDHIVWGDRLP